MPVTMTEYRDRKSHAMPEWKVVKARPDHMAGVVLND
jgi:hypothetical protein